MHVYVLDFYVRILGMLMTTPTCIFRTLAIPPVISYKKPTSAKKGKKKKRKPHHNNFIL